MVGVGPAQPDAEYRAAQIVLKPRDERASSAPQIIARLRSARCDVPGMTRVLPVGAGRADPTRSEPRAVPVHADGTEPPRSRSGRSKLADAAAARRRIARRRVGGAGRRRAAIVEVDREKAGAARRVVQAVNDTLNNAFGQRQISTIYGQANQYRVVLEAQPRYQQRPARAGRSSTSPSS